jgi:hypothetical protein
LAGGGAQAAAEQEGSADGSAQQSQQSTSLGHGDVGLVAGLGAMQKIKAQQSLRPEEIHACWIFKLDPRPCLQNKDWV